MEKQLKNESKVGIHHSKIGGLSTGGGSKI